MSNYEHGSFTYANPPTILWGAGSVAEHLAAQLDRLSAKRVFFVGTRSVVANPKLAEAVLAPLGDRVVGRFYEIGQHVPAADLARAVDAARVAQPDLLLAMGGGSPIDAAKAIAFSLASGLDYTRPDASEAAPRLPASTPMLPIVAVPTTLSVAELASSSGFSAADSGEKVSVRHPNLLPRAVLYDAYLAVHTPLDLWLSTGIRAVDHAVESLLSRGSHPFSDTLALEGLKRLNGSLRASKADPSDLESRTQAQLGAWMSYTLPAAAAGLSHTLGKRIGASHNIPHGVTSCLLLPHVMRYLRPRTAPIQARIASASFGVDASDMSVDQAAACAADPVADLIVALGQPHHLAPYGLSEADLEEAVRPVASDDYPAEDLLAIYRAAW